MSIWNSLQTDFANLPIENVAAGNANPRRGQDQTALQGLADSIERFGILQPIIVRKVRKTTPMFEVVAGGRRYAAAKKAGLRILPCIIVGIAKEQTALEVALTENLHREDLCPIDAARAVKALMEMGPYTQEEVGKRLRRSQPEISKLLAILELPEEVQEQVRTGALTKAHAKELLPLRREPEKVREMANAAVGASSREVARKVAEVRREPLRRRELLSGPVRPPITAPSPMLPRPASVSKRSSRPQVRLDIQAATGNRCETLTFPDDAALEEALSRMREFAL